MPQLAPTTSAPAAIMPVRDLGRAEPAVARPCASNTIMRDHRHARARLARDLDRGLASRGSTVNVSSTIASTPAEHERVDLLGEREPGEPALARRSRSPNLTPVGPDGAGDVRALAGAAARAARRPRG